MRYLLLFFILIFFFFSAGFVVSESEVPFEVVKTRMIATTIVPVHSNVVVLNGQVYDPNSYDSKGLDPNLPDEPWSESHKGEIDSRVKVPIEGIKYTLEFWNVGKMGGEKGFIFKSDYGNAKLKIEYITGQAYKMVGNGKKFGNLEMVDKKEVSTPSIDDLEYDLTFSGGPYGQFTIQKKDGIYLVGKISGGRWIQLYDFGVNKHLIYEEKAELEVKGDGFEKWMQLLEQMPGCQDPSDPTTDSGYRFNGYDGEIYIYPCDDENAQMYPELDMVLHRNDLIITEDDSTADIAIPGDMTNFHMAPNSKVILNYQKEDSKTMRAIKIISGKILRNVKRALNGDGLEDDMWQAAAGIKGTTYVLEELGEGSTLKVIEGSVEFKSKVTGETEMVKSGEMITATEDGLGKKKKFNVEKELKYWDDLEKRKYPKKKGSSFWFLFVFIFVGFFYYSFKKSYIQTFFKKSKSIYLKRNK